MNSNNINDVYSQIFKTYPSDVVKEHVKKMIEFDHFYPYDSTFFCITNTSSLSFEYISKNFEACSNLSETEMYNKGMNYFWSRIHPDDIELWLDGLKNLMIFTMNELSSEERKKISYTWNYRIKNGHDKYVNIIQNTTPLQFDIDAKPIIGLAHYTLLDTDLDKDICIYAKKLNNKNVYENIYFKNLSNQNLINSLSSREIDIVRLLITRKKIDKIAESLCISPSTVTTHRKNIFKKLNIHSTAELINYFKFNPKLIG